MRIDVVRGNEAISLLGESAFRGEWFRLWGKCPWATAFQGPGFCTTWYGIYHDRFKPLLVLSPGEHGHLDGLLPLAVSTEDGELVVAGAGQAEYHCWISLPDLGDSFAWHAVQSLRREIQAATLTFQYLPPKTPIGWLASHEATQICKLKAHRRPLLRFGDREDIARSLKKKSNKSRLSRLEKMGPLEFKRITDPTKFERFFDDIVLCYDFRQAALHGSAPFLEDQLKKPFHLAIMKVPGLLHATILRVGNQFAAAHLGACSNKEVQLGIIAHNPLLARHSPGKFHILFLAQMLMLDGYEQLDLTAGGDAYKDRFANAFDEVNTLTIFPSCVQRWQQDLRESVKEETKRILRTLHIAPSQLKKFVGKLTRVHPVRTLTGFIRGARAWTGRYREMRIYSYDAAKALDLDVPGLVRRDALQDLLMYQPVEGWQPRESFLSTSLSRIEDGNHVYTYAENGRLLHFGWLIERQSRSFIAEVCHEFIFPPNSARLFDFYTVPEARGHVLYTLFLRTMLYDAARIPGMEKVYIAVLANDDPLRHVIENLGFTYEGSLFEELWFGRVRRWSSTPLENR